MAFEHYFRAAQGFAMMLIYILLAFVASPQFAFLVLLAGLASNYLYVRIFRRTKKLSLKVSLLGHTFQNLLIQNINHFKYLKATGRIHQYKMKLKDRIVDIENAQLRLGKLNAILFGSRETIASIIVILVIFVKVSLLGGAITAMLLSLIFFYRALSSVFTVQNNWNSYLGYSGSMEEVRKFSEELSKKQEERRGTKSLNQLQSIQLRNLSYRYAEGPLVIDSVDLEIRAGETIALVGESGSGKSTLVNLISALLDNYEGQILLNNEDLKLWEQESWHGKIGYIAQEAVVFDDSIANNINFWSNENTEESRTRLESVIQKSAIHNYVAGLKKGTDSLLGYNGVSMSVGQKQRISIAREIYKTGLELMIFDEATSALDSHTEQIIKENLERMRGSCIMILIAHRLATIRNADRIVLMDKGAVSAIGSFEELINSSPKFRSMVELQEF
jgi:subfamily B ATP-binding cassette protein MsbA